ncbi:amidase family protein [Pseudonocardia benzenivorans]
MNGDTHDFLEAYRAGADPRETVAGSLARLRDVHEALNTTIAFLDDRALAAAEESARRWASGTPRVLEGVPFAVKDVIDVAGVPTTGGSWVCDDAPAARSAEVVRRLEAAGAIAVSKDTTTEFAVGGPNPPASVPPATRGTRSGGRAARRWGRRQRWRRGRCRSGWAPTSAARCGCRRPGAGSPA